MRCSNPPRFAPGFARVALSGLQAVVHAVAGCVWLLRAPLEKQVPGGKLRALHACAPLVAGTSHHHVMGPKPSSTWQNVSTSIWTACRCGWFLPVLALICDVILLALCASSGFLPRAFHPRTLRCTGCLFRLRISVCRHQECQNPALPCASFQQRCSSLYRLPAAGCMWGPAARRMCTCTPLLF